MGQVPKLDVPDFSAGQAAMREASLTKQPCSMQTGPCHHKAVQPARGHRQVLHPSLLPEIEMLPGSYLKAGPLRLHNVQGPQAAPPALLLERVVVVDVQVRHLGVQAVGQLHVHNLQPPTCSDSGSNAWAGRSHACCCLGQLRVQQVQVGRGLGVEPRWAEALPSLACLHAQLEFMTLPATLICLGQCCTSGRARVLQLSPAFGSYEAADLWCAVPHRPAHRPVTPQVCRLIRTVIKSSMQRLGQQAHSSGACLLLVEVHKGHKLQGVGVVVVVLAAALVHPQLDQAPLHWRPVHCMQRRKSAFRLQALVGPLAWQDGCGKCMSDMHRVYCLQTPMCAHPLRGSSVKPGQGVSEQQLWAVQLELSPDQGSQATRARSVMPYSSRSLRWMLGSCFTISSARRQSSGWARACTP